MREVAANTLKTFAVLSLMVGGMLTVLYGGFPFWADGRFTDFTMYLVIGGFFYAFFYVWRIDYLVNRGRVDESTLPFWLRND